MRFFIGCAAIVGLSAVSAMAGDGRLSNQSLHRLGLGGMALLSDTQGLEIRGLGVSEGTGWEQGDKDHQQKDEKNKHHEQKHHENKQHQNKQQDCHEHQHQRCGQSTCHISSLCHVQTACRVR